MSKFCVWRGNQDGASGSHVAECVAGGPERGSGRNAAKRCGSRLSDRTVDTSQPNPASRPDPASVRNGLGSYPTIWTPLQPVRSQTSRLFDMELIVNYGLSAPASSRASFRSAGG